VQIYCGYVNALDVHPTALPERDSPARVARDRRSECRWSTASLSKRAQFLSDSPSFKSREAALSNRYSRLYLPTQVIVVGGAVNLNTSSGER
jgi:hypothetical protein